MTRNYRTYSLVATLIAFILIAGNALCQTVSPRVKADHLNASAQKGPLRLTLTLASNRVPRGGPLWFRLSVANTGKKPFFVSDPIFARKFLRHGDDFIDYLGDNHEKRTGFYLVVLDAAGHEVDQYDRPLIDYDVCGGYDPFKPMSRSDMREYKARKARQESIRQSRIVRPGHPLETIAWSYHGFCRKGSIHSPTGILGSRPNLPKPPGRFAELYGLDLSKPGYYWVYAALNHVQTKKEIEENRKADRWLREFDQKHGFKTETNVQNPDDAVIRSNPIRFEVLQ